MQAADEAEEFATESTEVTESRSRLYSETSVCSVANRIEERLT